MELRQYQEHRRYAVFLTLVLMVLLALASLVRATDGFYDPIWGSGGRLYLDVPPQLADASWYWPVLKPLPDGRLLLGGYCEYWNPSINTSVCLTRRHPDGSADISFGPSQNGSARLGDQHALFRSFQVADRGLARLPDGRLVVVGSQGRACSPDLPVAPTTGCSVGILARLSPSGQLQTVGDDDEPYRTLVFASGEASPHNRIAAVAATADGKILVAGEAARWDHIAGTWNIDFAIARLDADLRLDPSFAAGAGQRLIAFDAGDGNADRANQILPQAQGKIVLVGHMDFPTNDRAIEALARLNPDGSLDNSFGTGGRVHGSGGLRFRAATDGTLDQRGRLLTIGTERISGGSSSFRITRWLNSGVADLQFGHAGHVFVMFNLTTPSNDHATGITVQSDGRILVVGAASRSLAPRRNYFGVARLTDFGELDSSFGSAGRAFGTFDPGSGHSDEGMALYLGNGGLMVAGYGSDASTTGSSQRFGLARL